MGDIKNLDRVNPIKRSMVKDIVSQIDNSTRVEKLVVFGSSIRDDCKPDSDLDIAIKWNEDCFDEDMFYKAFTLPIFRIIMKVTDGNNDIIPIGYEGSLKSVIENGVTVYE